LPPRYRLPLLVLDATGMRLGELEHLTWGDVDEPRQRWRVSAAVSKTSRARWVSVPLTVFAAVLELCPRDDRTPERRVFDGFGGDRFRTAVTRACTAVGVPAFSPHDLRHRRISLLHRAGIPWARIGEHVGQRNLAVTANTYTPRHGRGGGTRLRESDRPCPSVTASHPPWWPPRRRGPPRLQACAIAIRPIESRTTKRETDSRADHACHARRVRSPRSPRWPRPETSDERRMGTA
jgi:hypothetical protein